MSAKGSWPDSFVRTRLEVGLQRPSGEVALHKADVTADFWLPVASCGFTVFLPAKLLSRTCVHCRRSFAFSHAATRRRQSPVGDIETGQAAPEAQLPADDNCSPRGTGLVSAASAPNALERQNAQNLDSPASPSTLHRQPSALSTGLISPAVSPNAQSTSANVLGKLLGSRSLKRSPSGTQPVCLICLENLTPEDFEASTFLASIANPCFAS